MQNPIFELWVPAGGSGTPPMHSNVFVGVFDLRLEFTRPPVVASAAENQKYLAITVVADLIQGSVQGVAS